MATPARMLARTLALIIVVATFALGTGSPASADGPGELVGTLTTSDGGDISGVVTLHHWDAGSASYSTRRRCRSTGRSRPPTRSPAW